MNILRNILGFKKLNSLCVAGLNSVESTSVKEDKIRILFSTDKSQLPFLFAFFHIFSMLLPNIKLKKWVFCKKEKQYEKSSSEKKNVSFGIIFPFEDF